MSNVSQHHYTILDNLHLHHHHHQYHRFLMAWNDELVRIYTLSTIILGLYLGLGIFGNALVLIIYKLRMKSKKDDRYFIPALAVVDLLGSAFASTFSLIQNIRPVTFPGSFWCKFLNYGTSTFIIASLALLLIISIQRYQKICRPFGFQMSITAKRLATFLALLLANLFSVPVIILYQNIEIVSPLYNGTGITCGSTPGTEKFGDIYRGIVIFSEVFAVVCMSFLYTLVGRKLYNQFSLSRKLKDSSRIGAAPRENLNNNSTVEVVENNGSTVKILESSLDDDQTFDTAEKAVPHNSLSVPRRNYSNVSQSSYSGRLDSCSSAKDYDGKPNNHSARRYSFMFMVISLVAILCYIPPWTLILYESKNTHFWNDLNFSEAQAFSIIRRLYIVNHIANPFIYGFFDSKFRHEIKRLVCKCCK